jgi:hypothetical protein
MAGISKREFSARPEKLPAETARRSPGGHSADRGRTQPSGPRRKANGMNTNGRHGHRQKLTGCVARRRNVRPRDAQRIVNALLLELREALGAGDMVTTFPDQTWQRSMGTRVLLRAWNASFAASRSASLRISVLSGAFSCPRMPTRVGQRTRSRPRTVFLAVFSQIAKHAEDQFYAIVGTELVEHAPQVTADRADRHPRGDGDLLIRHATKNAPENVRLAWGQSRLLLKACPILSREQLRVADYWHSASRQEK